MHLRNIIRALRILELTVPFDSNISSLDLESPPTSSKKIVKNRVQSEMKEAWSSKLKSLSLQGQFLNILESAEIDINWKFIIYKMPRNVLQNSSIDTLPTNANLVRWNKRSSPNCRMPK